MNALAPVTTYELHELTAAGWRLVLRTLSHGAALAQMAKLTREGRRARVQEVTL